MYHVPISRRRALIAGGVLSAVLLHAWSPPRVVAEDQIGSVTMLAGAPRMVGQSIRPLQPVLSGSLLETSANDAAGVLIEDVVLHVGMGSRVKFQEEANRIVVQIDEGMVAAYTAGDSRRAVVLRTPFGQSTSRTADAGVGSGWYTARHDPAQPNVPASSTFSTIEGQAEVAGIRPEAGPYQLLAHQKWRIVEGQIPGPPSEGDERGAAENLQDLLHRRASELAHAGLGDIALTQLRGPELLGLVGADGAMIYDVNDIVSGQPPGLPLLALLAPLVLFINNPPAPQFTDPQVNPPGSPATAGAQFIGYQTISPPQVWIDTLPSVNGNPGFQPIYLNQLQNGGLSYIQLAGSDAFTAEHNGELFLVGQPNSQAGWALFTPQQAVADAAFANTNTALRDVVTQGFAAVALGTGRPGGGAIGGDGVDPNSAFAFEQGGQIRLNPNLPAGYPQLDQAANTTGLTVNGQPMGEQIAAIGAGVSDPNAGPLLFISDSGTDALGNTFNFDGARIEPTQLGLPAGTPPVDQTGQASLGRPLAADASNTVGVQFAPTGDIVAIIHHTGLRTPGGAPRSSEHFEIVRGENHSIVQWRPGARVTGPGGQVLELNDLNQNVAVRDELFGLLCGEINGLTPPDNHTVCGPAVAAPDPQMARTSRFVRGRLVRSQASLHRTLEMHRMLDVQARSLSSDRTLQSAGGKLLRPSGPALRRFVGRTTAAH